MTPTPDRTEQDEIARFVADAATEMLRRMRDGERRGWHTSWREDYPDVEVALRLDRASIHLMAALTQYNLGAVGIDEVRKRAADVANQAFMLADPERGR